MTSTQFIWWLTGYMEFAKQFNHDGVQFPIFTRIEEILRDVICWEIEQGDNK